MLSLTGSKHLIELSPLMSNCPKAFAYKYAVLDAVGSFLIPTLGPSSKENVAPVA